MNKVILSGRLTKNPDIRYTQGQDSMCIARYTLAVDRRGKDKEADFINCAAFGKAGEFAERYLTKGMKIILAGRLTTGSYTKQDGTKAYTTEVTVESQEFCESKAKESKPEDEYQKTYNEQRAYGQQMDMGDGFMSIPDDVNDNGLPFN